MSGINLNDLKKVGVSYENVDGIAVIRVEGPIHIALTRIDHRETYLGFLDDLDNDRNVKAIVTVNDDGVLDEAAYGQLLTSIVGENVSLKELDSLEKFKRSPARWRQLFFLRYLLKRRLKRRHSARYF